MVSSPSFIDSAALTPLAVSPKAVKRSALISSAIAWSASVPSEASPATRPVKACNESSCTSLPSSSERVGVASVRIQLQPAVQRRAANGDFEVLEALQLVGQVHVGGKARRLQLADFRIDGAGKPSGEAGRLVGRDQQIADEAAVFALNVSRPFASARCGPAAAHPPGRCASRLRRAYVEADFARTVVSPTTTAGRKRLARPASAGSEYRRQWRAALEAADGRKAAGLGRSFRSRRCCRCATRRSAGHRQSTGIPARGRCPVSPSPVTT